MKDQRKWLWVLGVGCLMAVAFGYATYKSVKLAYNVAFGGKGDSKSASSAAMSIFGGKPKDGNVAVVDLEGVIMSSRKFLEQLTEVEEDKNIKAIVIRVNSPGGAVAPSQEIYDRLVKLRAIKKVVCSFDSIAASGGYYIGAGCEKIVSNAGTLTGSIGVIMPFMNLKELYQWAKLSPFNIKSGKFKDIGSEARPMTDEERVLLQTMVSEIHSQFKDAIKIGRPQMDPVSVDTYADGRIFTGAQGKAYGFIDELGGEDRAIEIVAEMAGIKKPVPQYWNQKKDGLKSFLEDLGYQGQEPQSQIFSALSKLHPILSDELQAGVPYLLPQHWFPRN